jgi:pimeloyl-ACP methyl ester carboxylesterase
LAATQVDFLEAGSGPLVVLVHCSASGARQWRRLMDDLKADFHVRAVNLFGYGKTPPWSIEAPQTRPALWKPRCRRMRTAFALSATPSAGR